MAQETMMAKVNQMIPLSGQPKRFYFRRRDGFFAVAGFYGLMSKLCYKQTQDLTAVIVIFHNKNFLLHSTFRRFAMGVLLGAELHSRYARSLRLPTLNYEESTCESYITMLAEKDVLLRHLSSILSQSRNRYC